MQVINTQIVPSLIDKYQMGVVRGFDFFEEGVTTLADLLIAISPIVTVFGRSIASAPRLETGSRLDIGSGYDRIARDNELQERKAKRQGLAGRRQILLSLPCRRKRRRSRGQE